MTKLNARGAIRVGRRAQSKRLVIKLPTKRSALLGGTALAAMVLMGNAPAYAEAECGGVTGGPTEWAIECNAGGNNYTNGINYTDVAGNTDKNITIRLDGVTVITSDPAYNAGAINYYTGGAFNISIVPLFDSDGDALVNTITGNGVDGMFVETVGGDIDIASLNGTITATGSRATDTLNGGGNAYGYSYTGSVVNGIEAVSHGGDISITRSEGDNITSAGNGIYADASATPQYTGDSPLTPNGTQSGIGGGTVDITNLATITANGGDGIRAIGETITIKNLSTDSIHSSLNGINALGGGGLIDIWNGDGGADNPDGLIDAGMSGIFAENHNGGDITVHNGSLTASNQFSSDSAIHAEGDYGIYAYSFRDSASESGVVKVFNEGLVQLDTEGGSIAGIFAGTGDGQSDDDGYVAVFNGFNGSLAPDSVSESGELYAINARVNAYDPTELQYYSLLDNSDPRYLDADGVVVDVSGGDSGLDITVNSEGIGSNLVGRFGLAPGQTFTFNALAFNSGEWDFSGEDNYLTPGFFGSGDPLGEGDTFASTTGGIYAPGGSAIKLINEGDGNSLIYNDGTVIGQGDYLPFLVPDPVVSINTQQNAEGDNYTVLYNGLHGLIGSTDTPFAWDMTLEQGLSNNFNYFGGTGVVIDWASLEDNIESGFLGDFTGAANDRVIGSNAPISLLTTRNGLPDAGNSLVVVNDGLLIGRVVTNNSVSDGPFGEGGGSGDWDTFPAFDGQVSSVIINNGAWFVSNNSTVIQTNSFWGEEDGIENFGLIQTALDADIAANTTFGSAFFGDDLEWLDNYGVISMIDSPKQGFNSEGDPNPSYNSTFDRTVVPDYYWGGELEDNIFKLSEGGGYAGADNASYGTYGYVGIDVFFGPEDGVGNTGADQFWVHNYYNEAVAGGSTGLIIHKLNAEPGEGDPGTGDPDLGILVAHADNVDDDYYKCGGGESGEALCSAGDLFFISDQSQGYQKIDGYGAVRDGLNAWFLKEVAQTESDPDYYLVSQTSPDEIDQPGVTTTVQGGGNAIMGVVHDHLDGNIFPAASGGGGADLPTPMDAVAPPSAPDRGALWGRIVGDWEGSDSSVTEDNGGPLVTYDTGRKQHNYALQGGVEFRPMADDDTKRLGIYAGYVSMNSKFDTYSSSSSAQGFTVGGYGELIKGDWYIDAEVKGDFLDVNYKSPFVDIDTSATNIGVLANTGYRMEKGNSFFEPIFSFSYLHTQVADATSGADSITYDAGESLRAGIGARVGTTFATAGGTNTELDLLGKVWDEFGRPNRVTISDGANPDVSYTDSISGVFGEVEGRATVYNSDRTSSGFVSVGGKFGSEFTSIQAKAGLRKSF